MTAHVFNLHLQLLLRALGGSLEGHVLQKVSRSIVFGRFVARSSVNPNTNGGRLAAHDGFTRHSQARVHGRDIRGGGSEDVVGKALDGGRSGSEGAGGPRYAIQLCVSVGFGWLLRMNELEVSQLTLDERDGIYIAEHVNITGTNE